MSMPETARSSRTQKLQPSGIGSSVEYPTRHGPHFALRPATMHPLRFEPIIKRLIWGGNRLGTVLRKPIGEGSQYAESWELSDHRTDVSVVADGPLAGMSLRDLVRYRTEELLGDSLSHLRQFPLLVKYIDAEQVLSVQVHPDDERGRRLANDNGKTETWVVIAAEPGSVIYAGLKPGVTREAFAAAIEAGEVEPLLHKIPATPGDCILIPAGIVHAIGAGVMLAEIQQMSDATFRVFDWNRLGVDGKPRPLHIAQALESIDFEAGPVEPIAPVATSLADGSGTVEILSRTEYFALERFHLQGPTEIGRTDRFTIVLAIDGDVRVEVDGASRIVPFGETALLPASIGPCRIAPAGGRATVVTCIVP